jgi:hypothetical protein
LEQIKYAIQKLVKLFLQTGYLIFPFAQIFKFLEFILPIGGKASFNPFFNIECRYRDIPAASLLQKTPDA